MADGVSALIRRIAQLVEQHYVLPEVGREIADALLGRLAAGAYGTVAGPDLTEPVTRDLQSVNGDRHLRLLAPTDTMEPGARDAEARFEWAGLGRVERLAGNVAVIELRRTDPPELAGPVIAAAMTIVADAAALLIDLRRNGGGSPETVALVCSYLFSTATHVNDVHERGAAVPRQYWTSTSVPGRRIPDSTPVYVLTSATTFSAAEELAYDLQQLGRATVVGETTRGGAHPTRRHPVSDALTVTIPYARSVNPVSGTNWEGTGVVPDLPSDASDALRVAHRHALRHITGTGAQQSPLLLAEAREALAGDA